MRRNWLLLLAILVLGGCSTLQPVRNPLKNLTEKQSDWFERTSQGWRF